MITSTEFAKLIGVSQSTVSRAMNDSPLVPEEKRKYIQAKAREHGFVLNSQARSLKTRRTGTIGIVFPLHFESLSKNLMFTYIYDVVQRELISNSFDIMMIYDYNDADGINTFERVVRSRKVDGIVNLRTPLAERERELIENYSVPFVTIFNDGEWEFPSFVMGRQNPGIQAAAYFSSFPAYTPAYIGPGHAPYETAGAWTDSYNRFLREAGADPQRFSCEFSTLGGYNAVMENREFFLAGKTASYVYNDILAFGVVRALLDLGIPVPDHAMVLGNNDIPLATWLPPALSTLQTPVEKMVHDGCGALFAMINGNREKQKSLTYSAVLLHRNTTLG